MGGSIDLTMISVFTLITYVIIINKTIMCYVWTNPFVKKNYVQLAQRY